MSAVNRYVCLRAPIEEVPRADDFEVRERAMPVPGDGEVLLRHLYLSLDPYQRPAIAGRHGGRRGALGAGDMPEGETVGVIVESRAAGWPAGTRVRHAGGWQEYSVAAPAALHRLPSADVPASAWLGVLGMPGLTAWASVVHLAAVTSGQTVLVSAASGPVGSLVGQLAMVRGARAIGIAGSAEKCRYLTGELGFAACVNYKDGDLPVALRSAAPDGVHVYHDNVGGPMLMDALMVLRPYGTVVLCGLMSQYNTPEAKRAFNFNLGLVILKRAVLRGLVVYDFEDRRAEFEAAVAPAVAAGRIRFREDRATGIGQVGAHFARLMRGENFGKALVVLHPKD